ncbi:receptor-type tyrosine-protein phosphatase kappa-like [Saccostrea echinata]|uniref:receptor-type tyrosine-protein phosphatase kappa-like n=1 Tax=Saccostrea echinata TaxID=191078 RepID=UPI002A7EB6AF|nr:receptor-type tyrosine-protein phosphatase kappa-like [Saccostrea echinata]
MGTVELKITKRNVYLGCQKQLWGENCTKACSSRCRNENCNPENGKCVYGCEQNFDGDECEICDSTHYGQKCEKKCSTNCLNGTCFSSNGTCLSGCVENFAGDKCSIDMSQISSNKGGESVIIQDPDEDPQEEKPEEAVYYSNLTVAKDIAVTNLLNLIREKEFNKNEGFVKEFKSLPYGERFDCTTAKMEDNLLKNRFKTTFPYDHSRVKLALEDGFTSDYINANYIDNIEGNAEYIACQGPKENTVIDHWRMIWQENVECIVMLTNLTEGSTIKCNQYWPDKGKELKLDPFLINLEEEMLYANYVIRTMTLQKISVNWSRTVIQFHYTRWPDHGTPNPLNFVVFHRHFRHKMNPSQHPILVHCSAGIGRTGTFVAFDVLTRYGSATGNINVIEYVKAMRKDRMSLIQNADQYVFLYKALYEFFRRKGVYIKREEFIKCYSDSNRRETKKKIADEFNKISTLKPAYDANDFKMGRKYPTQNSAKSVLPVDHYLVYLTSYERGRDYYYNAVTVSSFTRPCEFISAQLPVTGAAIDLARLLVDQESHFLISFNPLSGITEMKDWVDEEVKIFKLGPYEIIRSIQSTLKDEIRKTDLKVKEKKNVHLYECLDWNIGDVLPADTSTFVNLIKQFSLDRISEPDGPVTLVSVDGATCCGVFMAVYNAIEQLQQDNEVDICTIVQHLQCCRPEMISTKEEYEFCFRAVCDFFNTDSVYANI